MISNCYLLDMHPEELHNIIIIESIIERKRTPERPLISEIASNL